MAMRALALGVAGWGPVLLVLVGGSWLRGEGATTGAILGALTYLLEGLQQALQSLVRELGGAGAWLLVSLGRILEADRDVPPEAGRAVPGGSTKRTGALATSSWKL
jgi:ATP-binding cassette subfamily C protein